MRRYPRTPITRPVIGTFLITHAEVDQPLGGYKSLTLTLQSSDEFSVDALLSVWRAGGRVVLSPA